MRNSFPFVRQCGIIKATVSEESLSKLGALICAAELLWTITFWGYSNQQVGAKVSELETDKSEERVTLADLKVRMESSDDKAESAITEWLLSTPPKVKQQMFDFIMTNVTSAEEDEITFAETIKRLQRVIANSKVKHEKCISDILFPMLRTRLHKHIHMSFRQILLHTA